MQLQFQKCICIEFIPNLSFSEHEDSIELWQRQECFISRYLVLGGAVCSMDMVIIIFAMYVINLQIIMHVHKYVNLLWVT